VRFALAVALAAACLAASAAAQTSPAIRGAKAAGQVGERYDGFLGSNSSLPTGVRREVEAVNIRRRSHYSRLAAAKGVSPQEVGITAGCMTLGSVGIGEAYLLADNRWRRRLAGQPAPVPSYCIP
jgi:uncharacterized protein